MSQPGQADSPAAILNLAIAGLLAMTITMLITTAAGLLILRISGDRLLSVQTASMVPAFRPGDAIIVRPVLSDNLRPGDIISYRSPRDPNLIISHRLINVDHRTGWLTTAGDALRSPDPAFPPRLLVGRATAVAPKLGLVLNELHRPAGLALAVYLPAAITIITEARHLTRTYTQSFYSVRL